MDLASKNKQINKIYQSEWLMNNEKKAEANPKNNKYTKKIVLNSCNTSSELKHNFCNNTQLKNISINFGFPSTRNTYKYKNTFALDEFPVFEQRNYFYYDRNFRLFKNKSVSKYGEKKDKNSASFSHRVNDDRILSPQHKILTSIKKKKFIDDQIIDYNHKNNEKDNKNEKDVYELEVINQILYDEDESVGNNKKLFERKNSKFSKELENEWGEIEQIIYDNESNQKNNLLNSVYVEIEKENGDTQYKYVEISKEDKHKKNPCIKIKYTMEDKLCLSSEAQSVKEEQNSLYDKETAKDSVIKSLNYKTNTNSTSNINNSTFKKENVSEILLKESRSNNNLLSSSDNEKLSGSVPTSKKYRRFGHYKEGSTEKRESLDEVERYKAKEDNRISYKKRRFFNEETEETKKKRKSLLDSENTEKDNHNESVEIEQKYYMKKKIQSPTSLKMEDKKSVVYRGRNSEEDFGKDKETFHSFNGYNKDKIKQEEKAEFNFGSRFKVKEKDLEQEQDKTSVKEKENKLDRYKYYDEEEKKQTLKSEEKNEVQNIRDKYRKKKQKEENTGDSELKIIDLDMKKNRFAHDKNTSELADYSPKNSATFSFKQDKGKGKEYQWAKSKSIESDKNKIKDKDIINKESEKEDSRISKRIFNTYKEQENEPKKETETDISERKKKYRRFGVGAGDDNREQKKK